MQDMPDYNYISAKAFLAAVTIMDDSKLITLEQVKTQPHGSAFLGVTNCQVPGQLLSMNGFETQIIIDSGSDITLISLDTLSKLSPRPKPKTGEEIELGQISGKLKITNYVDIPIYFDTKKGPILLLVEAYIVPNMAPPFIIGNDFAEQYKLSILRSEKGTRLIFGDTGRSMNMHSSIYSTEELHAYIAKHVIEDPPALPPRPSKEETNKPSKYLHLIDDVNIKPRTGKVVKIKAHWPEGRKEAFAELISDLPKGIQVLESIISQETPDIIIFNTGNEAITVKSGTKLGKLLNPDRSLDKPTDERVTMALSLKALVKGLGKPTEPVPEGHPDELEGGPKTSQTESDPIPSEELLEALDINPDLDPEQQKKIEEVILKRKKAFGLDGRLGHHASKFEIRLKEGAEPVSMRPYHASPRNREVIDTQIDKWLKLGVIEPSKSPWGFPVVIVFRNGKPRFCVDYRQLNTRIKHDEYPLPRQSDILNTLTGSNWLSTFDALSGFNQMEIKEEDRERTAFRSHRGLYQFIRVPFGIQSGPTCFQRIMNETLAAWLWIFVLVYIDDIVVFSKLFQEHLDHIDIVLKAIEDTGLTLAPDKCHIGYQSLRLLGQKVSRLGISTIRERVDAINAMKPPTTVKELQSILGMWQYYRGFMPYYTWIVSPLFKLL